MGAEQGWIADPPPDPPRDWPSDAHKWRAMHGLNGLTRDQLAGMSDAELLAYQRAKHANPYMSLRKAQALRDIALRFWHLRR